METIIVMIITRNMEIGNNSRSRHVDKKRTNNSDTNHQRSIAISKSDNYNTNGNINHNNGFSNRKNDDKNSRLSNKNTNDSNNNNL